MQIVRIQPFIVGIALAMSTRATASDVVFRADFESGTTCAWSSGCATADLLADLAAASTKDEYEAAFLSILESELRSVPPEVKEAIAVSAAFIEEHPDVGPSFLTVSQAHELATVLVTLPPSMASVLSALTADIESAYANPAAVSSSLIILMFSSTPGEPAPLPIAASTRLTLAGSFLYPVWLAERSSASPSAGKISAGACNTLVTLSVAAATTEVVVRNTAAIIYHIASVVLSSAEAIASCSTGGATGVVDAVLDAAKGCVIDGFVSWVEVEAESECVASVEGPPSAAGCISGLVPCVGDVFAIIDSSIAVSSALTSAINAVCGVVNTSADLHAACDAGCPACSELSVETACSRGGFLACFDPLNDLPKVSCVGLGDPYCAVASP